MKIDLTHIIGGAILALLAYNAGRKAGTAGQSAAPRNDINGTSDWWTYAGQWGSM